MRLSDKVFVVHLSILCDNSSLLFCFFCFLLGFALHNIHVFHTWLFVLLFLIIKKNKKIKEEKGRKMCLALFFLDLKSRLAILSLTCLCTLFSLDVLILLHFTSLSLVVHVVWELFIVFDYLILILKSYAFDCWTWTWT